MRADEIRRLLREADAGRRASLVVIATCRRCGALATAESVLGADGEPARPRFAAEIHALCDAAWSHDPNAAMGCPSCGAPPSAMSKVGLRVVLPMIGSGADLVVERVSSDARASFFRAPIDGVEAPIGGDGGAIDDATIERVFGRALSLAAHLITPIDHASNGVETFDTIDAGTSFFSGPREDRGLEARVRSAVARAEGTMVVPIGATADEATLATWLGPERARAIASGAVRAGLVVDPSRLGRAVARALASRGIASRVEPGRVIASRAGVVRVAELPLVLAQGVAHGYLVPEIADLVASEIAQRIDRIATWLDALRDALPEVTVSLAGDRITSVLPGGAAGRALDVALSFGEPTQESVLRAARFVASDVPAFADPTRLCPCGASALLRTDLVAWPAIEHAIASASDGESVAITARFPGEGAPRAASVVVIACDAHHRYATADDLRALEGDALSTRLARDLAERTIAVQLVARGPSESPAIVARGPGAASLFTDDGALVALDHATGATLGARTAHAIASPPDLVAIVATDAPDPEAAYAQARAIVVAAADGDARLVVERDIDLRTRPLGTVVLAR